MMPIIVMLMTNVLFPISAVVEMLRCATVACTARVNTSKVCNFRAVILSLSREGHCARKTATSAGGNAGKLE